MLLFWRIRELSMLGFYDAPMRPKVYAASRSTQI